jgi:hypothetical protein
MDFLELIVMSSEAIVLKENGTQIVPKIVPVLMEWLVIQRMVIYAFVIADGLDSSANTFVLPASLAKTAQKAVRSVTILRNLVIT